MSGYRKLPLRSKEKTVYWRRNGSVEYSVAAGGRSSIISGNSVRIEVLAVIVMTVVLACSAVEVAVAGMPDWEKPEIIGAPWFQCAIKTSAAVMIAKTMTLASLMLQIYPMWT
jgi:hypothetical protein